MGLLENILKLLPHLEVSSTDITLASRRRLESTVLLRTKIRSLRNLLNVAPDILKRLFPGRTRRPGPIIPVTRLEMNLFRFCSGLKVFGYFMILLVFAVVAVSYYAVIVTTWWPILIHGDHGALSALAAFIVFVFHFLLIMLLWSYFTTVFTDPGFVPENFRRELGADNLEAGTSTDQGAFGSLGYCAKCRNVKPPRCHHCSVCQRCVLKMDHHCVWIVNCVGARNYKFFLLFLFYTFLETMLDVIVLLPSFIKFFGEAIKRSSSPSKLASLVLAFVLNLAFVLSLLCFVVMHISLLSSNTTSVEVHEKNSEVRWKYDLGKKKNFEQVFGKKKAFWLLPLYSKDNLDNITSLRGLEFPTHSDIVS